MILSKPLKSSFITKVCEHGMNINSVEYQGWRYFMEDSIIVSRKLDSHMDTYLFAVFDGHCSDKASRYLADNLANKIDALTTLTTENICKLITTLDLEFIKTLQRGLDSGSTINMVLLENVGEFPYHARVFNLGDSRCFQYDSKNKSFIKLSEDHKPELEVEKKRIENAGGEVSRYANGPCRINSDLSMSRAFGDMRLKAGIGLEHDEQMVISVCDVKETIVNKGDILVMSCDGLYENSIWEEVFEVTKNQLSPLNNGMFDQRLPHAISKSLLDFAVQQGSMDNISIICICFGDYMEARKETKFKACNFLDFVTSSFELLGPYKNFAERFDKGIKDALEMSLEKFFRMVDKKKNYIKKHSPDLEKLLDSYSMDVYKQINTALDYKYLYTFMTENEVKEVRDKLEARLELKLK